MENLQKEFTNHNQAKQKYNELSNIDFSKLSVEQIKLNITERQKYLFVFLNPKLL